MLGNDREALILPSKYNRNNCTEKNMNLKFFQELEFRVILS